MYENLTIKSIPRDHQYCEQYREWKYFNMHLCMADCEYQLQSYDPRGGVGGGDIEPEFIVLPAVMILVRFPLGCGGEDALERTALVRNRRRNFPCSLVIP